MLREEKEFRRKAWGRGYNEGDYGKEFEFMSNKYRLCGFKMGKTLGRREASGTVKAFNDKDIYLRGER
jgi:hypothetical protein